MYIYYVLNYWLLWTLFGGVEVTGAAAADEVDFVFRGIRGFPESL